MAEKIPRRRLILWLAALVVAVIWLFLPPKTKEVSKPKEARQKAVPEARAFPADLARELIVSRNIFLPLVVEEQEEGISEPGEFSDSSFPFFPQEEVASSALPTPSAPATEPVSPFEGISLRGIVESSKGQLALLEGPAFPSVYLAPGQSQGQVRLEKLGADWVELSAGRERKILKLPREFSVEPLGPRKGGASE